MNEVTGPKGSGQIADLASQRIGRPAALRGEGGGRKLDRASDDSNVRFSAEGRALSQLSSLPQVRTELVNRIAREVNDPDFDLDAKFALAIDRMIDEAL